MADFISTQEWRYFRGKSPWEALRNLADAMEENGINDLNDPNVTLVYYERDNTWGAGTLWKWRLGELDG